jgi:hypothetical protein
MKKEQRDVLFNLLKDWQKNNDALFRSIDIDNDDDGNYLSLDQALKEFKAVLLDNMQGLESVKSLYKK